MEAIFNDRTDRSVSDRDSNGRFTKGNRPVNGFDKRPEDRSRGNWKKSDTPRGKLEKMMTLIESEVVAIEKDENAPFFERSIARVMLDANWNTLSSMIDQVYGRAKESIDIKDTSVNDPIIRGFVIPTLPDDFIKLDQA